MSKKDSFKALQAELARRDRVRERISAEEFDMLSEEEQQTEYQLSYLAELLVEIYIGDKCRKNNHKDKRCEECRKDYPAYLNF